MNPQGLDPGRCRSCGAALWWGITAATGSRIPLDRNPTPDGILVVRDGRVVSEVHPEPGETRYTSHHATCPQGHNWRRRASKGATTTQVQGRKP